jgi:hypothetical protein
MLEHVGHVLENRPDLSQVVCAACARKLKAYCDTHELIAKKTTSRPSDPNSAAKRKFSTPTGKSPSQIKHLRVNSPVNPNRGSRKSLFGKSDKASSGIDFSKIDANLNIDDLDVTSQIGFAVKVCIAFQSGNITVKSKFEDEDAKIIKNICLSRWKTAINVILKHPFMRTELLDALVQEVNKEIKNYSKSDSCLKVSEPDQLCSAFQPLFATFLV